MSNVRPIDNSPLHEPLGRLVLASSGSEMSLRRILCALLDSKYGMVVAAGRMTSELIQMCLAVVKVHTDISEEQRGSMLSRLQECSKANERRNRFVHDHLGNLGTHVLLVRSRRLS